MIGAVLISGIVAAASSLFATLSNFVLARKFPEMSYEPGSELPEALFIRITWYRSIAKLFYLQALVFWFLFAVLLVIYVSLT